MILLFLLQAAAPAPAIELHARVQAREMTVERTGTARLEARAEPDGGSRVTSQGPRAGDRRTLRNVDVEVRGEARVAAPETPEAAPR